MNQFSNPDTTTTASCPSGLAPHGGPWRRALRLGLVVLVAAGGSVAPLVGPATADAYPRPARECVGFGVNHPRPIALVDSLEAQLGCRFTNYRWYQEWNDDFEGRFAQEVVDRGAEPEFAWQPREKLGDGTFRGVPYAEITSGRHDAYLRAFARDVKRLGRRVSISFAPEMNGDWGVYQITRTNTAQHFIAAHRHIVTLFRREGAQARWIWTPNLSYHGQKATFGELYPGDEYVDTLGLDGYNWGKSRSWSEWTSFAKLIEPSYKQLVALSNKPIQMTEVASVEQGGDKAGWIRDMCASLPRFPRLERLNWFNNDNTATEQIDWRIESSPAAVRAFSDCTRLRADLLAPRR